MQCITVSRRPHERWVRSDSSYRSASELAVALGLGTAKQAERVTVRRPSGTVEELGGLTAGNEYRVREGAGVVRTTPLRGRGYGIRCSVFGPTSRNTEYRTPNTDPRARLLLRLRGATHAAGAMGAMGAMGAATPMGPM